MDNIFELGSLTPQSLGTFRVIPDIRDFQFADNFDQTFAFNSEVKDTPSGRPDAPASL
jgi:hypothetical protein